MVHTSLAKLGYVCGGAQIVIEALIDVVTEDGTIKGIKEQKRKMGIYKINREYGGYVSLAKMLRGQLHDWKVKSMEACNYQCVLTGSKDYQIHHLYGFNKIFDETCTVFDKMGLEVTIDASFDDIEGVLNIELSGPEMGIIIGKRGQTHDALQYLISLFVNKKSDTYIRIKLDTENYRERRRETLENLAKNISYKVKKSRRPFALEPMNPYERRIIHSTLQGDKFVTTKSEGEEPYRKVVVYPKRNGR